MFKERLAEEMKAAGLSRRELADRMGVSPSMVGYWLDGAEMRRPIYKRLIELFPSLASVD